MKKFLSLFLALSLLLGVCGVAAAEDNTFSVAIVRWTDGWGVDFTQTAFLKEIGEATEDMGRILAPARDTRVDLGHPAVPIAIKESL